MRRVISMRWRMPDSIPVILNARAGTGTGAAAVREAFARQGLVAQLHVCERAEAIDDMLDALLAQRPRVLVAAGGDGTVTSVAARLLDSDSALGVLPLGTLNHFAKDLELPLELDGAVRAIATGEQHRVDVGEVNGRVFLNNSSLGLYPRIVVDREAARRRLHLGKWPALVRATWRALRDPHSLTVTLRVDGAELRRRTPFLFIGNNRYILQGLDAGTRPRLDGGLLSLHVLREQAPAGFLWLALRTLFGRMAADRDFESHVADAFLVDAAGDAIEVACDGEVSRLSPPLHYRVRSRALRVLVPAAGQETR
jgi:diacylglycerol kinase family enzyme